MNDFTKEDWEEIYLAIEASFYTSNRSQSFLKPILQKIQSMIENYCEHENTIEDRALLEFCRDCGHVCS